MKDITATLESMIDYYINGIENDDQEVLSEILEKIIDFEPTYKIKNGVVIGVEGYLCFGAPNIYLDTEYNEIKATWGDERISKNYEDTANIFDILADTFNM